MARGATWGATWHLGHVAEPGWPARGAGGTNVWQEATQTGPRGRRVGRHVWLDYRGRKDNFNRGICSPI